MIAKYRKKPVVIDAWEFTLDSDFGLADWCGGQVFMSPGEMWIEIETLEGIMKCSLGDYIVKGINGEFYPVKPNIFKQTYEKVD